MFSTVKVYPNGLTAGVTPSHHVTPSGLKADVSGWSLNSSRSNTRFLYSVRAADLTGFGLALSLTVRDCPETHEDWKKCREALLAQMRRLGMIRLHWLTEWQRRGVPHMHAAVWFPDPGADLSDEDDAELERQRLALTILAAWLRITAPYRSLQGSQTVARITDELGWLKYLSKHAARGAAHYQRAAAGIPKGWQKTGRMWGHRGDWPTDAPVSVDLVGWITWFRFRRICRSYRLSQTRPRFSSRAKVRPHAVKAARRMLRCTDGNVAAFRGVSGWIPCAVAQRVLDHLKSQDLDGVSCLVVP